MANNLILAYLHAICHGHDPKHGFFEDNPSFSGRGSDTSLDTFSSIDSPVEQILQTVQQHLLATEDAELQAAEAFFTPLVLHHWQLTRLLDVLRCQIEQEIKDLASIAMEYDVDEDNEVLALEVTKRRGKIKDNLEAALLLATLLRGITENAMSAPWISDRFDVQQKNYRALLKDYFDVNLDELFDDSGYVDDVNDLYGEKKIELVRFIQAVYPNLRPGDDQVEKKVQLVKLIKGMGQRDATHTGWLDLVWWFRLVQTGTFIGNPFRLGALRIRRFTGLTIPLLGHQLSQDIYNALDIYVLRGLFAYINWLFFVPRLIVNLVALAHHLCQHSHLTPLEKALSLQTRFRVHWTRFWSEVLNDLFWMGNGLTVCFMMGGVGAIWLGVTMQIFDVVLTVIRAMIELRRLHKMEKLCNSLDPLLQDGLKARMVFEQKVLLYAILHFWILLLCLAMVLPSMAAVSPMIPLVGGFCAIVLTGVTRWVNDKVIEDRQKIYEARGFMKGCSLATMSKEPKMADFVDVIKSQYIIADGGLWFFNFTKRSLQKLEFLDGKSLSSLADKLHVSEKRDVTEQELNLITSYLQKNTLAGSGGTASSVPTRARVGFRSGILPF